MKALLRMFSLLAAAAPLMAASCNKQSFSCDDERRGSWAVDLILDPSDDGSCPYEGIVVFEGEDGLDHEESELSCERSGDACSCTAGSQFGLYEVTITNTETGEVDRGVLEIEPAPAPICVTTRSIETFTPLGLGGAGGAGGAIN